MIRVKYEQRRDFIAELMLRGAQVPICRLCAMPNLSHFEDGEPVNDGWLVIGTFVTGAALTREVHECMLHYREVDSLDKVAPLLGAFRELIEQTDADVRPGRFTIDVTTPGTAA